MNQYGTDSARLLHTAQQDWPEQKGRTMGQQQFRWWLDEVRHAGPEHLDPDYVAGYDKKSASDWSDDIETLLALGVGTTSTVVDFGAGTGAFALAIAPHVARVVAVDVSEPMVAVMRARGVEAVRAGFLSYEHKGDPPDAIYTRNALHHLPDFWKAVALDRLAGLLGPGGALLLSDLIYSFEPREADSVIDDWLAAAPDDPATGWTAAELGEHVRDENSTFTWLLEPMLDRVGFEVRERELHPTRMYAYYTCIRR
jgi:SAM-dependent methyltransferase